MRGNAHDDNDDSDDHEENEAKDELVSSHAAHECAHLQTSLSCNTTLVSNQKMETDGASGIALFCQHVANPIQ